ncbi:MAG: DNA-3-methyladenine glycosylase, partial [Myxococcota bacterium]|nr:DNA-3-methyladenine glycosylase [Myxococcota bacterium]
LLVPCHRVVGAGGRMGGFSARGGTALKRRLLRIEGATIAGPPGPLLPGAARAAVEHLRRADPVMRRIVDRIGPCTLQPLRGGHFEAIVEAIAHQQLTGKAAATIFGRLRSLFPGRGFPRPAEMLGASDAALRSAGLSGRKVRYVKDLAARVSDGRLPLGRLARLDDERVVEALTAVDGVGRWTAEMFLIFRLGRADVLPVGDYGLRKAVRRAYGLRTLPSPARLREIALRWRPYRSVATWYLWRTAGPVLVGRRRRPAAASPRRLQQQPRHFPRWRIEWRLRPSVP